MKNKTIAYGLIVAVALSSATATIEAKPSKVTAAFEIAAGIVGVALTPCLLFMAFAQHNYARQQKRENPGNERGFYDAVALCKISAAAMITLSALSIKNGVQKLNTKKKKKKKSKHTATHS